MNVASLELCKKLFDLSEWNDTEKWWHELKDGWSVGTPFSPGDNDEPAYNLGYLLRKLPAFVEESQTPYLLTVQPNPIGKGWNAHYRFAARSMSQERFDSLYRQEEDTPEDALCQLAIELFKQGIL